MNNNNYKLAENYLNYSEKNTNDPALTKKINRLKKKLENEKKNK